METEIYARISDVRDRHVERFWADSNVTGFGVGLLQRPGPEAYGIIVSVANRAAARHVPQELDGVPVQIDERTFDYLEPVEPPAPADDAARLGSREDVINPMIGGISLGPTGILTANDGTLGLVVTDSISADLLLLSNAHVMCTSSPAVGDPVYQPAKAHTIFNYKAGELRRWREANVVYAADNKEYGIDAAVAATDPEREAPTTRRIYRTSVTDCIVVSGSAKAKLTDKVEKSGITTKVTKGTIYSLDHDVKKAKGIDMRRQIICQADGGANFSEPGDSGSVVVANGYVIGLLWGGTSEVGKTVRLGVVSPIGPVMQELQFTV